MADPVPFPGAGGGDPSDSFDSKPAAAPIDLIYDERRNRFWHRDSDDHWIDKSETQIKRYLKQLGIRPTADVKNGETVSPLDAALIEAESEQRVFYAGRLAGWPAGIHAMEGRQILVTRGPDLVQPTPGEWPTLKALFEGLFIDAADEVNQLPYFYGWARHVLESLYKGWWSGGLCMVLAGEVECGKSLVIDLLKACTGGSGISPYRYMIGRDNFNEELFESTLLVIDDENFDTRRAARSELGAQIKQIVATSGKRCRGMHQQGLSLQPLWRVVIATNLEPDNLMVLPPITDDIADKIMLLKAYKRQMPMAAHTTADRRLFWSTLLSELPHFVHWLLSEHQIPPELQGRFGVRHYHHPEILEAIHEISPEMWLHDIIQRALFISGDMTVFTGSAAELEALLKRQECPLRNNEKDHIPVASVLGKRLAKLSDRFGEQFYSQTRGSSKKRDRAWTIRAWRAEAEDGEPTKQEVQQDVF